MISDELRKVEVSTPAELWDALVTHAKMRLEPGVRFDVSERAAEYALHEVERRFENEPRVVVEFEGSDRLLCQMQGRFLGRAVRLDEGTLCALFGGESWGSRVAIRATKIRAVGPLG